MDPLRHVQPGEKMAISAAAWNRMVDAAQPRPAGNMRRGGGGVALNIRNKTGGVLPTGGAFEIQARTDVDSIYELDAVLPSADSSMIVLSNDGPDIADGSTGKVYVLPLSYFIIHDEVQPEGRAVRGLGLRQRVQAWAVAVRQEVQEAGRLALVGQSCPGAAPMAFTTPIAETRSSHQEPTRMCLT